MVCAAAADFARRSRWPRGHTTGVGPGAAGTRATRHLHTYLARGHRRADEIHRCETTISQQDHGWAFVRRRQQIDPQANETRALWSSRRRSQRTALPTVRRRGPSKGAPAGEPDDHALGRSRGGLTTKIHLAADGRCRPLALVVTPGQAGDTPAFPEVMARLRVPRPIGRPRTTPDVVLADKAYSSRAIRSHLRRHGIRSVIPQPADQAANRKRLGQRGGRPPVFDRDAYKQRNTVERCINKIKQWRGLATRYDKTATIHLAGLHIAAIFIWSER
ncbi:IS5 family transposase [Streptomyces sp. NBC_01637]|nr:IS5 family transposase [Streptomyces sp. NBC_01653]WTD37939.1 IS5 family transposase [Streptomyces sp. NBC_01643]WTD93300.1 IS5 family transposase [Streptomyces sp. NBC_01637]